MAAWIRFQSTRKLVYSIIFGLMLVRVAALRLFFPETTPLEQIGFALLGVVLLVVLWEINHFLENWLNSIVPYEKGPFKRFLIQFGLVLLGSLPIHLEAMWLVRDHVPFTYEKVTIIASVMLDVLFILAINLGYFGVYFFDRWKASMLEKERLEKEKALLERHKAQIQFQNLQNQLNPHFFFNSIASLETLIHDNQALATSFLHQLAQVYRYVLKNRNQTLVSLKEEITFAQQYTFLLETRFGSSVQFIYAIQATQEYNLIVPVTLQILIENALKHNQVSDAVPLCIRIFTEGDILHIENNLQPRKNLYGSHQVGLENLKSLYTFITDRPIEVIKNETHFRVSIPLLSP